jgi:hypothetical protein
VAVVGDGPKPDRVASRHRLPRRDRLVDRGHDLLGHELKEAAGELFVLPVVAGVEQRAAVADLIALEGGAGAIWSDRMIEVVPMTRSA